MLPVCLFLSLVAQDATFHVRPAVVTRSQRAEIAGAQAGLPPLAPLDPRDARAAAVSAEARATTVRLLGQERSIVIDRARPGGAWSCWVDADGDGVIAPDERLEPDWTPLGRDAYASVSLARFGIPAGLFLLSRESDVHLSLQSDYHLEASLTVGDEPVGLIWVDMDLDGAVTLGRDRWIALPESHLATLSLANGLFVARETDEPWYLGGRALTVTSVDGSGGVSLALGRPAEARHEFLARRARRLQAEFSGWFDADREAFLQEHEVDATREVAAEPPSWYYTHEFADALDLAAAEGKPLFVEFDNDACPWCKRLEWLNYRDAEVARRLAAFTLVKINVDLDREKTAERLGLRGVPQGVLFDAAGEPVHVVGGWMPPAEHVAELDAALEALAAGGGRD